MHQVDNLIQVRKHHSIVIRRIPHRHADSSDPVAEGGWDVVGVCGIDDQTDSFLSQPLDGCGVVYAPDVEGGSGKYSLGGIV
jgi:hypothetical protein